MRVVLMGMGMILALAPAALPRADGGALVVYSGRGERLIKPVLDAFTRHTGTRVTLHSAGSVELLNRLCAEGRRSPADVFLTVDAGTLEQARMAGLLAPLGPGVVPDEIPVAMQAADGSWAGVSARIRVIAYNPARVRPEDIPTVAALADPVFAGRLGLRTGSNVYVQSHVAMIIAEQGEAGAEAIVRGWVANAGDKIYPSDARAVEAVARGEIDVTIVNHYYVAAHLARRPEDARTLAAAVPESAAYNVSGVAVLRHSRRAEAARRLAAFLFSPTGQRLFAQDNFEYPVDPRADVHAAIPARASVRLSAVPLAEMGRLALPAMDLIDRIGYR